MSIENWNAALNMKVGDQGAKLVYQALCNRADPDGRHAWPSVAYLADKAECSERTVARKLTYLLEHGFIREGDQRCVDHLRADRRPVVYDVALTPAIRAEWESAREAAPRRSRAVAAGAQRTVSDPENGAAGKPSKALRGDTVVSGRSGRGDNLTPREPQVNRGDNLAPRPPRGDSPGFYTSYRPTPPPPTPSSTVEGLDTAGARPEEAEDSNELHAAAAALVAALPGPLTPGQRHRLASDVTDRLATGWTAAALTAELTVDLTGVRSYDAVYHHRLAALPPSPPAETPGAHQDLPPLMGSAHVFETDPTDPDSCLHCPRPRENRVHQTAPEGVCAPETPPSPPEYGYASSQVSENSTGVSAPAMPSAVTAAIASAASNTEVEANAYAA